MDLSEPGVGDFVLLDTVSEDAFMKNLELRFTKDRIYVSIITFLFGIGKSSSLCGDWMSGLRKLRNSKETHESQTQLAI